MPAPDRMLNTLRKAITLVRATPGRSGHFVQLENCTEVLVAGDLHGHVANFQVVMQAADLDNFPQRHLILQEVIHGPFRYPQGGEKSHQLVDLFCALKCKYPSRVHLLPGNHEMAQMVGRPVSKGSESLNELFEKGIEVAYGSAAPDIYAAYTELFQALPLALRTPNRVFLSHTCIPAKIMNIFHPLQLRQEEYYATDYQPGGIVYGLLWGRDTSETNVQEFLRKVDADWLITGHIPTETGYMVPNSRQLIVDCSQNPASYVLIPTDRPIENMEDLLQGVMVF